LHAHLTDIAVRALKPNGKQIKVWDSSTPGFGVIVGKSKSFFVMYGRRRAVKILGRYPDTPLAAARAAAKKMLAHAPPATASLTFKAALALFLDTHGNAIRARTKYDYRKALERHFLPKLSACRLDEITTSQATGIIDRLTKDTPSEANHAFMYARTFFRWAQKRRYIDRSPLDGLNLPTKSIARARVLTDAELKAVWTTAADRGTFGVIVKLLILTGQRRGEIAALNKEWISDDTITLPKEATKNGREHTFPVGALAVSALEPFAKSDGLLFQARGKNGTTPFNGWSKSKAALDEATGVTNWTLHDLRRTFASNLGALGVRLEVIEKLLNHVSGSFGGIVGVYQRHNFMPEMRAAVDLWEAKLKKILGSKVNYV
jgi:integrase